MNGFKFGCPCREDDFAEFFGGLTKKGRWYLTRMASTPESLYVDIIHKTENALVPDIEKDGVTYRCCGVTGSQPGIGGGFLNDPHAYMWFQTNFRPLGDTTSKPVAGFARVRIHKISSSDYAGSGYTNHEFTLMESWLVNDTNGNPEHWDEERKHCYYFSCQEYDCRKVCCGPGHFVFFDKRSDWNGNGLTGKEHTITYWTPGVADPVVKVWDNPERFDATHDWIVAGFDATHFPIALFFARGNTQEGTTYNGIPDDGTEGSYFNMWAEPEFGSVALYARSAVCNLSNMSLIDQADSSRKVILEGDKRRPNSYGFYSNPLYSNNKRIGILIAYDSDVNYRTTEIPYNLSAARHENCRVYCRDFAISGISYRGDEVNSEPDSINEGEDGIYLFPEFTVDDKTSSGLFGWDWMASTLGRGSKASFNSRKYIERHSTRDTRNFPSDTSLYQYTGIAIGNVDYLSQQGHNWDWSQDDAIGNGEFSHGNNDPIWAPETLLSPRFYRVFGSLYPAAHGLSSTGTNSNATEQGRFIGLGRGFSAEIPDDPNSFNYFQVGSSLECVYAGRHLDHRVDDPNYKQFGPVHQGEHPMETSDRAIAELVLTPAQHSPWVSGLGADSQTWATHSDPDGRIFYQGMQFPLSSSDFVNTVKKAYSIELPGLDAVGSPGSPSDWNDSYPFHKEINLWSLPEDTPYRVTDTIIFPVLFFDVPSETTSGAVHPYRISGKPYYPDKPELPSKTTYVIDTGEPYSPRGIWWDSSNTEHRNSRLSAGGPLVPNLVR